MQLHRFLFCSVEMLYSRSIAISLKGKCHDIFCFRFFSWIIFLKAPKNNSTVISNFFANSQTYSLVKVHHRYYSQEWAVIPGPKWVVLPRLHLTQLFSILPSTRSFLYSTCWLFLSVSRELFSPASWDPFPLSRGSCSHLSPVSCSNLSPESCSALSLVSHSHMSPVSFFYSFWELFSSVLWTVLICSL